MQLFVLLLMKLIYTAAELAVITPNSCSTPDCGQKEFGMKDVKFKINFSLGEISTKSKTDCDLKPKIHTSNSSSNCSELFKAVDTSKTIEAQMYKMQLLKTDSVICKINKVNTVPRNNKNGYDIHTMSDKGITYITAPESKCLSFNIKAKNNAKIILTNSITLIDRIEIVLGSYNNTKISYRKMRINCEHNMNQLRLLDQDKFVNFWLCWKSGKAILGQGDKVMINNSENIEINEKINFIGLETTHNATGTWQILESNCPGCYDVDINSLNYIALSCAKVQNTCSKPENPNYGIKTSAKQLFNLLKADQDEFKTKKIRGELNVNLMKKSLQNINALHKQALDIKDFLKICSLHDPQCKENQLDNSLTKFLNLYDVYRYEIKREILNIGTKSINCHEFAHLEFDNCVCNLGWAGDGNRCKRDTDFDGYPDNKIENCTHHACRADNCPLFPNSFQKDTDLDGKGDACDLDIDNDEIENYKDNCPYVVNLNQRDIDGDNIGDDCDKCNGIKNENKFNTNQELNDYECNTDFDKDGIINSMDNCKWISNVDQDDYDQDGIGDVCDNCVLNQNPLQVDRNQNLIGDVCEGDESETDIDNDGILEINDNCDQIPNSNQLDIDNDGIGDVCDDDIDDDNIANNEDNCVYVINEDQNDKNGNQVGDACEDDLDNDNVPNKEDICPLNPYISYVNFQTFQTISLIPEDKKTEEPLWLYNSKENTFTKTKNSKPGLLIGIDIFDSVEYNGTFFVNTEFDNDYIGFIFGYLNNRKFYTVMWRKELELNSLNNLKEVGLQIKLVDSETGPGYKLTNALYHHSDTKGQVKILWKHINNLGWKHLTPYRWVLKYIVNEYNSVIDLRIYEGDKLIIEAKDLRDENILGGRLGLFTSTLGNVIWANLQYRCI